MAEQFYTGKEGGTSKLTLHLVETGATDDMVTVTVLERNKSHVMAKRVFEANYRPLTPEELAERFPNGLPGQEETKPAAPSGPQEEDNTMTQEATTQEPKGKKTRPPKAAGKKPDTKSATKAAAEKAKAAQANAPSTRELTPDLKIRIYVHPGDTYETYASQTGDRDAKQHPSRLNKKRASEIAYQLRRLADQVADAYKVTQEDIDKHVKATTR